MNGSLGQGPTKSPIVCLPITARATMLPCMFVVSETEAAAIRTAFEQSGELAAAVELRRLFPGVTDNVHARECARTIAGWQPLTPCLPRRLHERRRREP
jgi:hypothetical protein